MPWVCIWKSAHSTNMVGNESFARVSYCRSRLWHGGYGNQSENEGIQGVHVHMCSCARTLNIPTHSLLPTRVSVFGTQIFDMSHWKKGGKQRSLA